MRKISPPLRSKSSWLILIIYLAGRNFCDIFQAEISLVVNFFVVAETRFMRVGVLTDERYVFTHYKPTFRRQNELG